MDEARKQRISDLQNLLTHRGWEIFAAHVQEEIEDGWNKFIELPVEKKTSKAAYDAQAKYKVHKSLLEWISDEIRMEE